MAHALQCLDSHWKYQKSFHRLESLKNAGKAAEIERDPRGSISRSSLLFGGDENGCEMRARASLFALELTRRLMIDRSHGRMSLGQHLQPSELDPNDPKFFSFNDGKEFPVESGARERYCLFPSALELLAALALRSGGSPSSTFFAPLQSSVVVSSA